MVCVVGGAGLYEFSAQVQGGLPAGTCVGVSVAAATWASMWACHGDGSWGSYRLPQVMASRGEGQGSYRLPLVMASRGPRQWRDGNCHTWSLVSLVLGKFGLVWSRAIFAGLETGQSSPRRNFWDRDWDHQGPSRSVWSWS